MTHHIPSSGLVLGSLVAVAWTRLRHREALPHRSPDDSATIRKAKPDCDSIPPKCADVPLAPQGPAHSSGPLLCVELTTVVVDDLSDDVTAIVAFAPVDFGNTPLAHRPGPTWGTLTVRLSHRADVAILQRWVATKTALTLAVTTGPSRLRLQSEEASVLLRVASHFDGAPQDAPGP